MVWSGLVWSGPFGGYNYHIADASCYLHLLLLGCSLLRMIYPDSYEASELLTCTSMWLSPVERVKILHSEKRYCEQFIS